MSWVTPKTNWVDGDYFNLSDYARIKGDIEYLQVFNHGSKVLEAVSITTIPLVDFFNNIVIAIEEMYLDSGMTRYSTNGRIWNAEELNRIEGALLFGYNSLNSIVPICTADTNASYYSGEDIGLL